MLTVGKENKQFFFRPDVLPAAFAAPEETVRFCCTDCYDEQITADGDDFQKLDMERDNPITGPLFIEGAVPGDLLRIRIQDIRLNACGSMCVSNGNGVYPVQGAHCRRFAIKEDCIYFDRGLRIPVRPMIGIIGCAPERGKRSTLSPGDHGGNMDIRELGIGSVLYLPVFTPGALLSVGDLHAVQGDGETAVCALETGGEVELSISVLSKAAHLLPTPFLETERAYYTVAADPSLDVCSVEAARRMQRVLMEHAGFTDAQAAMFLSLAGNLRISQVVNPQKGCIMELPKQHLRLSLPWETKE